MALVMDRATFEQRLTAVLDDFGICQGPYAEHTRLCEDLQIESFESIALRLCVEDAFGIEITDAEWAAIETVGALRGYVSRVLGVPCDSHLGAEGGE
ncbi:MAG TPA: hypothetical protein VHZ73_08395 [Vicinamibacterales bacterium]|nr:hypothetical protein [Vicinamibacterales bacterium]